MEEFGRVIEFRVPRTWVGIHAADQVGSIARELGGRRILILTDMGIIHAGLLDVLTDSIKKEGLPVEVFSECLPNVPLSSIQQCYHLVEKEGFDLLIGLGGGSVMDMVKLVGMLRGSSGNVNVLFEPDRVKPSGLQKILLPTTAGTGSEWSNVAVFTNESDERKIPIRNDYLWAEAAVIDPLLSLNLPPRVTAETGMDALSHAIEAYTSWKASTIGDMLAEKAIRLISENLRIAYAKGSKHIQARYHMAVAAGLATLALRSSASYIVHSFSYPLCMKARLSHGAACSLMLPVVMEFNLIGNLDKFARVAWLMGERLEGLPLREQAQKAVEAVRRLSSDLKLKQTLGEAKIDETHIPWIVDYVFRFHSYQVENNPRDLNREDVEQILHAAR